MSVSRGAGLLAAAGGSVVAWENRGDLLESLGRLALPGLADLARKAPSGGGGSGGEQAVLAGVTAQVGALSAEVARLAAIMGSRAYYAGGDRGVSGWVYIGVPATAGAAFLGLKLYGLTFQEVAWVTHRAYSKGMAGVTGSVAALQTKLAAVKDALQGQLDRVVRTQEDTLAGQEALRERVAALHDGQDILHGGQAELREGQAELQEGQAELRDEMRGRLGSVESELQRVAAGVEALHGGIRQVQRTLETVEAGQQYTNQGVHMLCSAVTEVAARASQPATLELRPAAHPAAALLPHTWSAGLKTPPPGEEDFITDLRAYQSTLDAEGRASPGKRLGRGGRTPLASLSTPN